MVKNIIIAILIVIVIGAGAWFYFSEVHHARIDNILSNPKSYEGKVVTIEGEVTDRTSFSVGLKFFKVKDETGEITVVTRKSLPEVRSTMSVKGRIDEAFPIGDQKLVVFVEESLSEKGQK